MTERLLTLVGQSASELLELTTHKLNSPPEKIYWDTERTSAEEPYGEKSRTIIIIRRRKDNDCYQLSKLPNKALIFIPNQSKTYLYLVSSGEYLALALNITWRKKNMRVSFKDMQNLTVSQRSHLRWNAESRSGPVLEPECELTKLREIPGAQWSIQTQAHSERLNYADENQQYVGIYDDSSDRAALQRIKNMIHIPLNPSAFSFIRSCFSTLSITDVQQTNLKRYEENLLQTVIWCQTVCWSSWLSSA